MTNSHKKQSQIRKLKINGVWTIEKRTLRQNIVNAFKYLLTDKGDWIANFNGLVFSKMNKDEATDLEVPFSLEEAQSTLSNLNKDKAPNTDGLTLAFWQFS